MPAKESSISLAEDAGGVSVSGEWRVVGNQPAENPVAFAIRGVDEEDPSPRKRQEPGNHIYCGQTRDGVNGPGIAGIGSPDGLSSARSHPEPGGLGG